MDVDTFDSIVETERRRVNLLVAREIAALFRPEGERLEVAQYLAMTEKARLMLPEGERSRLERLRDRLKMKV